jgi:hypothetical protein
MVKSVSRRVSESWQVANTDRNARAPECQSLAVPNAHGHQADGISPVADADQHPLLLEAGEFRKPNFFRWVVSRNDEKNKNLPY